MGITKALKPVQPQPGKPLYLAARDRIREAIDAGQFAPGEQMPSTKDLSERLEVSLVTAHRALQELVNAGVLQRAQGKGTFVHAGYLDGRRSVCECRLGLVFNTEASLGEYSHAQVFEGIRQAAQSLRVDLLLLRYDEDVRKECDGFIYLNPTQAEVNALGAAKRRPVVLIGGKSDSEYVCSIDVDHVELAQHATAHLAGLGHTAIGYIGGPDDLSANRERWEGFCGQMKELGLEVRKQWVLRGEGWRLSDRERGDLIRMLSAPNRPTAVFASGYDFALDVYTAARTLGLSIGQQLSVVGVDDPISAQHLFPPLTTLRQPLVQLGHGAITALVERVRNDSGAMESRLYRAELMVRRSSGPVPVKA